MSNYVDTYLISNHRSLEQVSFGSLLSLVWFFHHFTFCFAESSELKNWHNSWVKGPDSANSAGPAFSFKNSYLLTTEKNLVELSVCFGADSENRIKKVMNVANKWFWFQISKKEEMWLSLSSKDYSFLDWKSRGVCTYLKRR